LATSTKVPKRHTLPIGRPRPSQTPATPFKHPYRNRRGSECVRCQTILCRGASDKNLTFPSLSFWAAPYAPRGASRQPPRRPRGAVSLPGRACFLAHDPTLFRCDAAAGRFSGGTVHGRIQPTPERHDTETQPAYDRGPPLGSRRPRPHVRLFTGSEPERCRTVENGSFHRLTEGATAEAARARGNAKSRPIAGGTTTVRC